VRQCLDGAGPEATLTVPARNRRGRSFECSVRCRAFRVDDGPPAGIVLVMEEPSPA
jgi:hypothetical protein